MDLLNNKYRISTRLQKWDYKWQGAYFITICTADRINFFGHIQNGEMILNELGLVVQKEWEKTPELRRDMNLTLDAFVIMPNHFHGILCIGSNDYNRVYDVEAYIENEKCNRRVAMHRDPTTDATESTSKNQFGPQSKNLGSVIRGFKSAVTTYARKNDISFAWQSRFHDHIIRDMDEFQRIRQYIVNNPKTWKEDKFFN